MFEKKYDERHDDDGPSISEVLGEYVKATKSKLDDGPPMSARKDKVSMIKKVLRQQGEMARQLNRMERVIGLLVERSTDDDFDRGYEQGVADAERMPP